MIDPEILNYVKSNLDAGYSANDVKNALLYSGYSPHDVDEAIASIKQPSRSVPKVSASVEVKPEVSRPSDSSRSLLVMALTLFMVVLVSFSFIYLLPEKSVKIEKPTQVTKKQVTPTPKVEKPGEVPKIEAPAPIPKPEVKLAEGCFSKDKKVTCFGECSKVKRKNVFGKMADMWCYSKKTDKGAELGEDCSDAADFCGETRNVDIAVFKKAISDCEILTQEESKTYCISSIAVELKDKSLCENAPDKEDCLLVFEEA